MISKEYIILGQQGLHARPATALLRMVKGFKSVVSLQKGEKTVRINSMLNILALTIKGGETITVIIEGDDEANALTALDLFFEQQLTEL